MAQSEMFVDYEVIHDEQTYVISITKVNGTTFLLKVSGTDIITDIKKRIQEITRIGQSNQILTFNEISLENEFSLRSYGIVNGTTIKLAELLSIYSDNKESFMLNIPHDANIGNLKNEIHMKHNIEPNKQVLAIYIKENELNDNLKLEEIDNDRTLSMELKVLDEGSRGVCLIINNVDYTEESMRRNGGHVDAGNIRKTFGDMKYRIVEKQNVTCQGMLNCFEEIKDAVEEDDRMLIVFILCHGNENGIINIDNEILPLKDIWIPFSKKKFSIFTDKPKLFFLSCSKPSFDTEGFDDDKSNMFFGFPACSRFANYISRRQGTLYFKWLCKVVNEHPQWNISDIHQEVQSRLWKLTNGILLKPQMPFCENALQSLTCFI